MKTDEIRERYLDFFARRGHARRPSASLVPADDPTLLFTGAGMNQFKEYFLGHGTLPFTRATTAQKCLRTGDIDNVGRTSGHHTFFEMMGNFSFGDYFKREAILWAWEFLVQEMNLEPKRLRVSVYQDDDEAYAIWEKEVKVDPAVIHRFGAHDNFWPADAPTAGPNGPCGPCSEIFYDWGEGTGCGRPECDPSCDCSRFVEIWNLVFTQFDRQEDGSLAPLPQKNIDTGMGLERMAAVLQGQQTNFGIDLFSGVLAALSGLVVVQRGQDDLARSRHFRVADHVRAITFCLADGIVPSNIGRGYVLRKLLRRASLDGLALGAREPFLHRLVAPVGEAMLPGYPELAGALDQVARTIREEEEKYLRTIERGTRILERTLKSARDAGRQELSGREAFDLYATYGLPEEEMAAILAEREFAYDREAFARVLESERDRSREASKISGSIFEAGALGERKRDLAPTVFTGYEALTGAGRALAVLDSDGKEPAGGATALTAGTEGLVVLDRTPFYGEAGGQVGDRGWLEFPGGRFEVLDARRESQWIVHLGRVSEGEIAAGESVKARVDGQRRLDIARNHTATHLLHRALHGVLGEHAVQKGSVVAPDRLRFDFAHGQSLSDEELARLEAEVNRQILADRPLDTAVMDREAAVGGGAMALFGEKYEDRVRVVSVEDYSRELCGGTHLERTGQIASFAITGQEPVGAGLRRLEAVTGRAAQALAVKRAERLRALGRALRCGEEELAQRVADLQETLKRERREARKRTAQGQVAGADEYLARAERLGPAALVVERLADATPDELRQLADQLRRKGKSVAALLSAVQGEKVQLLVALTPDLVERGLNAGQLARAAAEAVGGKGGGKAELAQAGGRDPAGLDEAEKRFRAGLQAVLG